MIKTLIVDLKHKKYEIQIGKDLLKDIAVSFSKFPFKKNKILVVTNETIAPLYLSILKKALINYQIKELILPDGEQWKNIDTLNQIFDYLLEEKYDRSTTLIALGGGVIGDITGFAAACYQRGIPFVQIPTTLLAQVDSSVGGKTGINHRLGKNMIGAFYQPCYVMSDINLLSSLPDREYFSGIAEIIKYGLICCKDFYEWIEKNIQYLIVKDERVLIEAIYRSCEIKKRVVMEDETEQSRRAILNFGHTFGHALEVAYNYTELLHGEAVSIGMMMAMDLSIRMRLVERQEYHRLADLLKKAQLPTTIDRKITKKDFLFFMSKDKKSLYGNLRFVLLRKIGEAVVISEGYEETLQDTLSLFLP